MTRSFCSDFLHLYWPGSNLSSAVSPLQALGCDTCNFYFAVQFILTLHSPFRKIYPRKEKQSKNTTRLSRGNYLFLFVCLFAPYSLGRYTEHLLSPLQLILTPPRLAWSLFTRFWDLIRNGSMSRFMFDHVFVFWSFIKHCEASDSATWLGI